MGKYRIEIKEVDAIKGDSYDSDRVAFDLATDILPETIDKIISDIYVILRDETGIQTVKPIIVPKPQERKGE